MLRAASSSRRRRAFPYVLSVFSLAAWVVFLAACDEVHWCARFSSSDCEGGTVIIVARDGSHHAVNTCGCRDRIHDKERAIAADEGYGEGFAAGDEAGYRAGLDDGGRDATTASWSKPLEGAAGEVGRPPDPAVYSLELAEELSSGSPIRASAYIPAYETGWTDAWPGAYAVGFEEGVEEGVAVARANREVAGE